jgi:hypothetical protein
MTKSPFFAEGYRANDLLKLVHIDVCGHISVEMRGGYKSFISF